jgi:hypothetical protein
VLDKLIVQRGVSTDLARAFTREASWLMWGGLLLNGNALARRWAASTSRRIESLNYSALPTILGTSAHSYFKLLSILDVDPH